jgi:hypothetical protein
VWDRWRNGEDIFTEKAVELGTDGAVCEMDVGDM